MVESAYTGASKASARKGLRVRVPLPAPLRGGVLAERARWVGVHVGRGAEPPGTPAFRHVAVRPLPVGGPAPRTWSPYVRCRSGGLRPRTSSPYVRCRPGAGPPDLVTVRAVPVGGRPPAPPCSGALPCVRCRPSLGGRGFGDAEVTALPSGTPLVG